MTKSRSVGGLLVAILMAVVLWWTQGDGTGTQPTPSPGDTPSAQNSGEGQDSGEQDSEEQDSGGLPVVAESDLPAEARDTLALIDQGGPFPYEEDGTVFQNREGILPDREEGYYREHTVETPGSDDRGARRIVTGSSAEFYWTDDHYASFSQIERTQ